MTAKIQKWGNSLALRIPKTVARDTKLENGSAVNLAVHGGKIVVEPLGKHQFQLDDLLKDVTKKNVHAAVDTGPAVGREVW